MKRWKYAAAVLFIITVLVIGMAIKHSTIVTTGQKGQASEWNADHVQDGNHDCQHYQFLNQAIENRTDWPAGPVAGQVIYRTDLGESYIWDGSAWLVASGSLRAATIIIAANNSQDKLHADYVCDGISDESEINSAIAALPATGGRILLLDGTYNLSDSIIINKSRIALQGQGKSTILVAAGLVGPNIAAVEINNSNYVVVRDMSIEYSADVYAGVYVVEADHASIKNVLLTDFLYAIALNTAEGTLIEGCVTEGVIYALWADTSSLSIITDNNMLGLFFGIWLQNNCDKNLISNNHVQSSIAITDATCDYNMVHGNISDVAVTDSGTNSLVANNINY